MAGGYAGAIGAAIGSIAQAVTGPLISGAFNKREAKKQRRWQEYMSNTAYQRARRDLEAAGFNPLLAIARGPASTPSGASARMAGFDLDLARLGRASAEIRNMNAVNAQTRAQTNLTRTQDDVAWSQKQLNDALWTKAKADERLSNAKATTERAVGTITRAAIPNAQALERLYKSEPGAWVRILKEVMGVAQQGASTVRDLKSRR